MDVSVEVHCEACGSANYSLAGAGESARLRCNDCGADQGDVQELKAALAEAALAQRAEALRSAIGEGKE